jgi:hypothetical protein
MAQLGSGPLKRRTRAFEGGTKAKDEFPSPQDQLTIRTMDTAIEQFIAAHERYQQLDELRPECGTPQEREHMYIEILRAYMEVQYRAMIITGMQTADGMEFARSN